MTLATSIARNTLLQTVGKVLSVALGWATVVIMTRSLGAAAFGEYTIMTAFLQFFGVAADFGFVLVTSQLLAERPGEERKVFANLFTFRLVTAAVILAFAPLIIWFFPYSTTVALGVCILSVSFLMSAIIQTFTGLFQKELAMGSVVLGELLSRVVLIAAVGAAAWSGGGVLAIAVGVVLGAFVNTAVLSWRAQRIVPIALEFDPVLWRAIWHRAWPLTVTIVLNLLYLKTDTLILSLTRPLAEVGVYGAMYRVFEVLITFPTMFAGLLLPVLVAARQRGDVATFQSLVARGSEAIIFAAVPMVVGVALAARPIVALFGADFAVEGPRLLVLLVIANAFVFIGTYFAHLVVAVDQQRRMIIPFAITAIVGLAGYLAFIPPYGAVAAAIMTIVAEFTIAVLAYFVARRVVQAKLPVFKPLAIALLSSIPMAAWLVVSVNALHISIVIGVAGVLYIGTLLLTGNLPRELFTTSRLT